MHIANISPITETGTIGIMHLKRFWSRTLLIRTGKEHTKDHLKEYTLDQALMSILRLSVEPVLQYLFSENPSFEVFEAWILQTTRQTPRAEWVRLFNQTITDGEQIPRYIPPQQDLLTTEQWDFWNTHGYLIIPNALSSEDCEKTSHILYDYLQANAKDPSTWYQKHDSKQKIMVQLFHHEQLEKNRHSARVKHTFEQLWQRNDILPSADRVSFNPPETPAHPFQGPDMHWDVSLKTPIPFCTQGLIYLSDTAANQGAFTLVPGFHHRADDWLKSLPENEDPRNQDLHALGSVPLAAKAGDLIVWHQALPHGSSPNTAQLPRLVQYINYAPIITEIQEEWI